MLVLVGYPFKTAVCRSGMKNAEEAFHGILNAVIHGVTNALTEGLNNKIETIKRNTCGYRNKANFRTAILFHCGKLDLLPH